jgi:exo-beta-1,3-glucanase (GH17 family)
MFTGKYLRLLPMIVLIVLTSVFWGCNPNGRGGVGNGGPTIPYRIYGLDFGPYMEGQDPGLGSVISEQQIKARMEIISPYTRWIRTYGCSNGLEKSGAIAHSLDLKVAIGAWISSNSNANEREISNLIDIATAGEADLLIVGSEVLRRRDISENKLIAYINRVKQEVPGIPITYADTYDVILSHPKLIDVIDFVTVNYYPYWKGIRVDYAITAIHVYHQQVTAAAKGKTVIVSETGWPSDGKQIGNAIPSAENASYYFLNYVSWAQSNNVDYFYFEAFDETWKAQYEGPQGAHWGVWDKSGNLKTGMEAVFNGETMEDNWSNVAIPGGPGEPIIEFIKVPPRGSFDDLSGQVWHIDPNEYKVAVYIYVRGWWTKPYWSKPLTPINIDGSWVCDITTGGVDERATKIAAYLLPNGYNPPSRSGQRTLPNELDENAVAKIVTTRQ